MKKPAPRNASRPRPLVAAHLAAIAGGEPPIAGDERDVIRKMKVEPTTP
jgi:hypothetical protein